MTAVAEVSATAAPRPAPAPRRKPIRPARVVLHGFLIVTALVWVVPFLWAVYTSLRTFADTSKNGYFSLASALTFENYENAWEQAGLPHYFMNSVIITVPRRWRFSCPASTSGSICSC
jgi:multiple sugar transport system permease protein